jgi:hypothetical protein
MWRISGCLTKLLLWSAVAVAFTWGVVVVMNPWSLHIGGRPTPLLYWHGAGTVRAGGGKALPLYVSFWPGRPRRTSGGGRREGRIVSARLQGNGWLCIAPGTVERMQVSGTMYGGYTTDSNSLLAFRLLEWRQPFAINPPKQGFFDLAGMWRGPELVLNRPDEQGIPFNSGLFVDHAVVTLRWATYSDFEAACRSVGALPANDS